MLTQGILATTLPS